MLFWRHIYDCLFLFYSFPFLMRGQQYLYITNLCGEVNIQLWPKLNIQNCQPEKIITLGLRNLVILHFLGTTIVFIILNSARVFWTIKSKFFKTLLLEKIIWSWREMYNTLKETVKFYTRYPWHKIISKPCFLATWWVSNVTVAILFQMSVTSFWWEITQEQIKKLKSLKSHQ